MLDEKRLVTRVLDYWRETAMDRRFPHLDQIDAAVIGDDWINCALIKFAPKIEELLFVVVGDNLLPPQHAVLDDRPVSACPHACVLRVMMNYLPRFHPNGGPLAVSGTCQHGGAPVLFRGVLLPLSDDDVHIDHVLTAASFRELHQGEEKDLKTRLEVTICRVEKGQLWEVFNPMWGGWGPAVVAAVDIEKDHASLRHKTNMQTISASISEMMQHTERYRFVSYS